MNENSMMLEDLLALCQNWDVTIDNNEKFSNIIKNSVELIPERRLWDLCNEFEVAPTVLNKWCAGVARPHPVIQNQIVKSLERRLLKYIPIRNGLRELTELSQELGLYDVE